MEGNCQCNRRRVGAASAECRHIIIFINSLKSCDYHNFPGIQLIADPLRIDSLELCLTISRCCPHRHLRSIEGYRLHSQRLEGHGHQRNRYLLSRYQQHVQFPFRRRLSYLPGLFKKAVRRLSHGGQNYHHVITLLVILNAAPCHIHDPLPVGNRTAAKFFHDQHITPVLLCSLEILFYTKSIPVSNIELTHISDVTVHPPLKSGVVRTVTFCCRPYIATDKKPGLLPRIPVPADNGKYRDSRMAAIISNTF